MISSKHDRNILQDLAKRYAEIAQSPVMTERKRLWTMHNSLKSTQPLMLIFPENSWNEILVPDIFKCESKEAQQFEWFFRHRIYTYEHFSDDSVLDNEIKIGAHINNSGWGLPIQHHASSQENGAWGFDPVLKTEDDIIKITMPKLSYDSLEHHQRFEEAQAIFNGIVPVTKIGVEHYGFHLTSTFIQWRGLEQLLLDMYEQPEFVHRVMTLLEKGHTESIDQLERLGLFSLNNNNAYINSGGNGYTDELPKPGFIPGKVRKCDVWACAESQEMSPVSPEMHNEFVMQYESRLLQGFGLASYGCCEPLTDKLTHVTKMPNMRRISISPWADVDRCAEQLGGQFIFSWKPHPAMLCGDFDPQRIKETIEHTLAAAKRHGCIVSIILKDTHTVEKHPERFDIWSRICREAIEQASI